MKTAYIAAMLSDTEENIKKSLVGGVFVIGVKYTQCSLESLQRKHPNIKIKQRLPDIVNNNYLDYPKDHTLQPAFIYWE